MSFIIRKLKRKDIRTVQAIAKTTWKATYEGIIPQAIQDNFLRLAYSDKMMLRRLKHSPVFVAESERKVVGFAQYTKPDKQGMTTLVAIYIYPAYQGMGIGTALLNEGIHHLGKVNEIRLNVERDNAIGRKFYEAKGFTIVTQYKDELGGHPLNTIQMKLPVR